MSKINKLSSSAILKMDAKEFTQKKVYITKADTTYEILVDEHFRTSKISKLVVEALENHQYLQKFSSAVVTNYFFFLLVKYFTDIEIANSDNVEMQIRIMDAMIDSGILKQITEQFSEEEMAKVNKFLEELNVKIDELKKENKSKEEMEQVVQEEIEKSLND